MNQDILNRIDALAEKLNGIGLQAWQAAVEYKAACAYTATISCAVLLPLMLLLMVWLFRKGCSQARDSDGVPFIFGGLISLGASIALLAVSLCNLPSALCPAGSVLMEVLR